jgi:NADH:ubiquinone oxidoreductase subunit E
MGSACYTKGNDVLLDVIKSYIKEHQLDAEIELVGQLCENKCALGPRIIVNDVEYDNITQEKLVEILKGL